MNMRTLRVLGLTVLAAGSAGAQTSMAACGPLRDSTSRQQVTSFGALRVCMLATKVVGRDAETPQEWAAKGDIVILETQRPNDNRRAAIVGSSVEWTINGRQAPMDSLAQAWQSAVVALADASFEADEVRRQTATLRSQIDSLPQKIAATKARITYLETRDRQLNLEILNANSRENAIRADISALESRLATAQSRASAAERQASAARDDRTRASAEAAARAAQQEVDRLSDAIMRAQRVAYSGESSRRVAAAQDELRLLQPAQNISLLKLQLSNYESIDLGAIEAQITQLDAPQRLPALDARVEKARLDLLAVLEARGKAPPR
jgi:chromosome segregation ATPase